MKQERDNNEVEKKLSNLKQIAEKGDNVMPAVIEAVKTYATVGEIGQVFRQVYGDYMEQAIHF